MTQDVFKFWVRQNAIFNLRNWNFQFFIRPILHFQYGLRKTGKYNDLQRF